MRVFTIYQPDEPDTMWSPEALRSLVGQEADVTLFGVKVGRGRVTSASPAPDHTCGPGIFVEIEVS